MAYRVTSSTELNKSFIVRPVEHFNVYALLDISGVGRKEVLAEVAYTAKK